MKRAILMFSVVAALFASILAAPALAYTKAQAEQAASEYAQNHYGGSSSRASCTASGKNKAGEAQYYCHGTYNFGANEYKVNVGPYGEITYHNP
jgi:hypothetical protein